MSIKDMVPVSMKRWARKVIGPAGTPSRVDETPEKPFADILAENDVIIMKHCFPASDVLPDTGKADPSSTRQSIENYLAVYRELRQKFDANPGRLFILWTLPPRHRLYEPAEGDQAGNAARASHFSAWLKTEFLTEGGPHPNIRVWDFRGLLMDPATNFLRQEYELNHRIPDSHPNRQGNNVAGPALADFIASAVKEFFPGRDAVKAVLLHHSTGKNVYHYPDGGIPVWFERYNAAAAAQCLVTAIWYPKENNMPVHYYRSICQHQNLVSPEVPR